MAILKIRTVGDPILRQHARTLSREELATPRIQTFIDDLVETMHHANGAGIAAPQVGHNLAIAAIHVQDNPRYPYKPNVPLTVFVNPSITFLSKETASIYEGCLSVPGVRGRVERVMRIRVDAWDREGQQISFEARGLTAGTYQHEFDHLQGLLFLDRVSDPKTLTTWENYDAFYKDAFEAEACSIVERFGD